MIGNIKYVSNLPSPSAYFCKVLASTEKKLHFSISHRCDESIDGKKCGHIRNVEMDGCTIQVGTGEKRCLVKERVEILSGEIEKLIFN